MKKAYLSPELKELSFLKEDAIMASIFGFKFLGDGDWGVGDDF